MLVKNKLDYDDGLSDRLERWACPRLLVALTAESNLLISCLGYKELHDNHEMPDCPPISQSSNPSKLSITLQKNLIQGCSLQLLPPKQQHSLLNHPDLQLCSSASSKIHTLTLLETITIRPDKCQNFTVISDWFQRMGQKTDHEQKR
ncbi:hypothetical protein AMECASPLE_032271 [Ameca splendens]|uniref:Uncharacterized protein n=1 Tax=Ameca splendens TaxID=208324 RepID=A0ABV1AE01_9TELE